MRDVPKNNEDYNPGRERKILIVFDDMIAKISALSSGKFDKYEYLTGEEILPSNVTINKK